jgi:hypothetical protein
MSSKLYNNIVTGTGDNTLSSFISRMGGVINQTFPIDLLVAGAIQGFLCIDVCCPSTYKKIKSGVVPSVSDINNCEIQASVYYACIIAVYMSLYDQGIKDKDLSISGLGFSSISPPKYGSKPPFMLFYIPSLDSLDNIISSLSNALSSSKILSKLITDTTKKDNVSLIKETIIIFLLINNAVCPTIYNMLSSNPIPDFTRIKIDSLPGFTENNLKILVS